MKNNTINILFAGDFVPPETTKNLYSENIQKVLKDKDFSIVNLETTLTNSNTKIKKTGKNFKRSPSVIKHLKDGFFDAVTLSNNHICDYGETGVNDTIKTCNQNNILTIGAGTNIYKAAKPLNLKIKGKKISILNYSEKEFNIAQKDQAGANPFDLIDASYQIQKEKEDNDYVIVVYHGGVEYIKYPSPQIVKTFRFLADIGADAVISHHTHFHSGMIEHHGKPLIFSLGNFYTETSWRKPDKAMFIGLLANLCIGDENYIKVTLIPTIQNMDTKNVTIANKLQKSKILNDIKSITDTIKHEDKLEEIWDRYYDKEKNRLINQFTSNSRFEFRLRKRFTFLNKISSYKASIILNILRCDAHRYKSIEILYKIFRNK